MTAARRAGSLSLWLSGCVWPCLHCAATEATHTLELRQSRSSLIVRLSWQAQVNRRGGGRGQQLVQQQPFHSSNFPDKQLKVSHSSTDELKTSLRGGLHFFSRSNLTIARSQFSSNLTTTLNTTEPISLAFKLQSAFSLQRQNKKTERYQELGNSSHSVFAAQCTVKGSSECGCIFIQPFSEW